MKCNEHEHLWVEKFRPPTIEDCILPPALNKVFGDMISSGVITNMTLSGMQGIGKTTIARALAEQLEYDYIVINGSMKGNIDTLRVEIQNFASSVSLEDRPKVIILDEADYLNAQSTQPALRGFMEEFSANCSFIMTCNFKNRILPALLSRCPVIDFVIPNKSKPELAKQFYDRLVDILEHENIKYDTKVVQKITAKYFPDFRKTLGILQKYSLSGEIDEGVLLNLQELNIDTLMKHMKVKDLGKVRKWVVDNIDNDCTVIYRKLYDSLDKYFDSGGVPQAILKIAQYEYWHAFVADAEVNLVACLVEIMAFCDFK